MHSLLRLAAGAVAAIALGVPAGAQSPSPEPSGSSSPAPSPTPYVVQRPTAVVVRIDGGYHPAERWLWFERDGTAHLKGILDFEPGRFRARADFRKVERILAEAEMCAHPGTAAASRPIGMDMFTYRVSVRCGETWRTFVNVNASEPSTFGRTRQAVRGLARLASDLRWQRADDDVTPPESAFFTLAPPLRLTPKSSPAPG